LRSRRLSSTAATAGRRWRRSSAATAGGCSRRWEGASEPLGLVVKPLRRDLRAFAHEHRIAALEDGHDLGYGNVGTRAALGDVLHVAPAARVVGMEEGVGAPVELERADP